MSSKANVNNLDRLYANRFSARERAEKRLIWATLCDSFLNRYVPRDGAVLDVGAGYCDFINHVSAARRIAIDLNPDTARYAAPGVEVHQLAFEELGEVVDPETIDLAFASNVFEHLRSPDALLEILTAIRQALKPGGQIIIMQPNMRRVGVAFWDFVDHTLPLTEKGMEEALLLSGFEMVERRSRFLPYTTKGMLPKSSALLRVYLKIRPLQWLLGEQMFLVGRRT